MSTGSWDWKHLGIATAAFFNYTVGIMLLSSGMWQGAVSVGLAGALLFLLFSIRRRPNE